MEDNKVYKEDFIRIMGEKFSITLKEASSVMNLYNETLKSCLLDGKEVCFRDLYKIGVKNREAYEGSDPRNKDRILIEAKRIPYCKFSKTMKNELNK